MFKIFIVDNAGEKPFMLNGGEPYTLINLQSYITGGGLVLASSDGKFFLYRVSRSDLPITFVLEGIGTMFTSRMDAEQAWENAR